MRTTATRRRSLLAMAGAAAGLTTILTPAPASASTDLVTQPDRTEADAASALAAATAPTAATRRSVSSTPTVWPSANMSVAALRNGRCESGEFCVYRDANRTGPVIDWAKGVDDRHYGNDRFPITGGGVGDAASSVWNRTGCLVTVYRDGNFGGRWVDIAPNAARNLGGTAVGNDAASSHNAQC